VLFIPMSTQTAFLLYPEAGNYRRRLSTRCHDATIPRYPDTPIPRCHDATMPRCHDATMYILFYNCSAKLLAASFRPSLSSFIMLSASPTCFRIVISLMRRRNRTAVFLLALVPAFSANPWDERRSPELCTSPRGLTADCYCKGSEDDDNLFRWRYTSVPYLWIGQSQVLEHHSCSSSPFHRY
jgi:hypothetical protein